MNLADSYRSARVPGFVNGVNFAGVGGADGGCWLVTLRAGVLTGKSFF
jgi:hypothetical protein